MDFVKDLYLDLMKNGSSQRDIDEMDILWYFELLGHAGKTKKDKDEILTPIDEIGFM